jgi:hypothetical protein
VESEGSAAHGAVAVVSEDTSVLQLGRVLAPRVRDSIVQHASIALQVEIKKQARQLVSPKRDMVEVPQSVASFLGNY